MYEDIFSDASHGGLVGCTSNWVVLSLQLIHEGQLSVSGERMCTSTSYLLRGLSLSRKSVVR